MGDEFGGLWTLIKLEVLKNYLEAYVKVFKNQDFYTLVYLDAFAGSGTCRTSIGEIDGSAKIALNMPRFDEYIFIEMDSNKVEELKELKKQFPDKKIRIIEGDCNNEITKLIKQYNWKTTRALAFLDPYSMELSFDTLKLLSSTRAFDIWYLFPLGAATRCLRKDGNIHPSTESKLNMLFGDNEWKNKLYYTDPQISFLDDENNLIRKDQKSICCYFRDKMANIFPSVLCPICLRISTNSPLFLLYFAVSSPNKNAQKIANRIASYIIGKRQTFVCNNPKVVI